VLLVPTLIIVAILLIGIGAPEAGSNGKGFLQILFTGAVSTTSGFFSNPTVQLNVVSVRLNPSNNLGISDGDPSWQTIAVPAGGTVGSSNPSLSFGGSFGPNGTAVNVGQGRSEIQINMGLLNSLTIFNTGKIRGESYGQVELVLDPATPGFVTPPCNVGSQTGEGCISYPLVLAPTVSTIRTPVPSLTVTRKTTQQLVINISAQLGPGPSLSTQQVQVTPSICVVPNSGPAGTCPPPLFNTTLGSFAGFIGGKVIGSTSKTMVIAELPNTGTIISSVGVDKNGDWSMILPVPNSNADAVAPKCPSGTGTFFGTYDFYVSTSGKSLDVDQGVSVCNGGTPFSGGTSNSPNLPINFTLVNQPHQGLTGTVFDACTGATIGGATLELYGNTGLDGTRIDCSLVGNPPAIPSTCVVIATASTDDTGAFPLPGNGAQASPFKSIPQFPKGQYALKASASGYNTEILGVVTAKGGTLGCPGSGFKKNQTDCNFSLPHGEIDVTANSTVAAATSPYNLLVTIEDTGTFNGVGAGLVTIPVGSTSNSNPMPIFVPAAPPFPSGVVVSPDVSPVADANAVADADARAAATPTASPTPVFIGAPTGYDVFASVQDLFGAVPQSNTGHSIAVLSNIAPPAYCQSATSAPPAPAALLPAVTCVGHGSVAGSVVDPDQNTQILVSKAAGNGNNVDLMTTTVVPNGQQGGGGFAICAPADSYTVTHVESQPTGTPIAEASTSVTLVGPTTIATPMTTPTPPPCQGICSDFSGSSNGKVCLLCQGTGSLPPL